MKLYGRAFFMISFSLVFLTEAILFLVPSLGGITLLVKVPLIIVMALITMRYMVIKRFYKNKHILFLAGIFLLSLLQVPFSQFPYAAFIKSVKLGFFILAITSFSFMLARGIIRPKDLRQLLIVALTIFIPVGFYMALYPEAEHLGQVGPAYSLLWAIFFGVVLVDKKDYFLIALIALAVITVFVIFKRGVLVCITVSLATYLCLYLKQRLTVKRLILFFGAPFVLLVPLMYSVFLKGDFIQDRLMDDSGGGRNLMYLTIFNGIVESSPLELVFGHGALGVQIYTGEEVGVREGAEYGLMAHNDWLTLGFDQGLLGLLIFLGFHWALFRSITSIRHLRPNLYTKFMAIYVSLVAVSFFSEILFTAQYSFLAFLIAFVTWISNDIKRNTHEYQ
jgi:O-antigen ligase